MKKIVVKEFITVKKVRYLPKPPPPPPPPPQRHVLVVGSCTLDLVTVCDVHPTAGVDQRTSEGCWRRGGSASDMCSVLRRLGTACEFLGRLSRARAFEDLLTSFHSMGIDISHCPMSAHQPTHRSIITIRGCETHTILEYSNRRQELTFQQFLGAVDYQMISWVHFEPRSPTETVRMVQAVRDFNERCPEERIILSADLASLKKPSLMVADLVDYVFVRKHLKHANSFMNGHETVWAVRDGLRQVRAEWKKNQPRKTPHPTQGFLPLDPSHCPAPPQDVPTIIYNNYAEGASCLLPDDTFFKVGPHTPQKIVDVIGENETFAAAVIYALLEPKLRLRDALEYGTRAAVFKVQQDGFDGLRCMPKDLIGCYYA
ncbi:ketohexokinase isoform X1 [Drosophila pseudoobscura]|uniref:Ketohexokinase isoform X1 n=2 Tax=Drosophila pseudoobscura pseudoobscura TaxID=46245 RepID=A0A6I8UCP6_DROPS|nr:ketohexokinase isoform X1 [Drosophila pseudoobscura]